MSLENHKNSIDDKIFQVIHHTIKLLEKNYNSNFSYFYKNKIPEVILNPRKKVVPLFFQVLPEQFLNEAKEYYISNSHFPISHNFLGIYQEIATDHGILTENTLNIFRKGILLNDPYSMIKYAECLIRQNEERNISEILRILLKSFLITSIEDQFDREIFSSNSFHYLTYYYDALPEQFNIVLNETFKNEGISTSFAKALKLIFSSLHDLTKHDLIFSLLKEGVEQNDRKSAYFFCIFSKLFKKNTEQAEDQTLIKILEILSNEGNPYASEKLGIIYDSKKEYDLAYNQFLRSEAFNLPLSLQYLGNYNCSMKISTGTFQNAYIFWKRASFSGIGLPFEYLKLIEINNEWERLFAYSNYYVAINVPNAELFLGKCYEKGKGVKRNFKISLEIYKSAQIKYKDEFEYLHRIAKLLENYNESVISQKIFSIEFNIHKSLFDKRNNDKSKSWILNAYRLGKMIKSGKSVSQDIKLSNPYFDLILNERINDETGYLTIIQRIKTAKLNQNTHKFFSNVDVKVNSRRKNSTEFHSNDLHEISTDSDIIIDEAPQSKIKKTSKSFEISKVMLKNKKAKIEENSEDYFNSESNLKTIPENANENIKDKLFCQIDEIYKLSKSRKEAIKVKILLESINDKIEFLSINQIRFDQNIGSGGNSMVYTGFIGSQLFAFKEFIINDNTSIKAILEEVNLQSKLNHENINKTRFLVFGFSPFRIIMVNDFVLCNLRYTLSTNKMSFEQKFHIVDQLIKGISYLHSLSPPVVHGDIKPENILIDGTNKIQICDFGSSRILSNDRIIETNNCFTLRYSPPERISKGLISKGNDIWALGLIIYEIFYENSLFAEIPSNNLSEFLKKFQYDIKTDHGEIGSRLISNLIGKCLSVDLDNRPNENELIKEFHKIRNELTCPEF